jgi:hypothetical protein
MGLATWSFGMVMTRSSSLTQVANFIAQIEEEPFQTVRSRLKEWYQPATAKKGSHRANLEVKSCFVPLLSWILDLLPPSQHQIALAIDATSIGDRFVVLSINILLAGSGIPVAWAIVPGNTNALWYGLRSTTECVYRDIKSDGWRWQRTRLTAPDRAERLWLAMAVATLWMLFLGGQTESPARNAQLPTLSTVGATVSPRTRQFSCFLQGLLTLLAELLRGVPIHLDCWTYVHSTPVDSFYAPNSS